MSAEELTTGQKFDQLVEFYGQVFVKRNGRDKVVYVGGNGSDTAFTIYGLTIDEAINEAYEEWTNRRARRAVKNLLR